MELVEEIARGLRRRQLVADQLTKRLVLAELIEVLGALAPAAHGAGKLSTISEEDRPRLRFLSLTVRSTTAAVPVNLNASIRLGTPARAVISPGLISVSILKFSRLFMPHPVCT